jgi:single-strand DNA-binding protein
MAHTIVIKLNKAANEFQAGESIGFNVRGGVQYYDRKTKQKEWTNYSAVIFAKAPAQIDFYRSALIEGSKVELSGKSQKIDVYTGGQNGPSYTIEFQDAWLGDISSPNQGQPMQQQTYQQPQQQSPQQQPQYQQPQQGGQQQPNFNQPQR